MLRGPLSEPDFKDQQFSGHETFPLRHLWLRKAYDAVAKFKRGAPKKIFSDPAAIIAFGVGKNMVTSIRHWAIACEIIEDDGNKYHPTEIGTFLFDNQTGRDPFMEASATTWLMQWLIAGTPARTTTWYYAFNHFAAQTFDREAIATPIRELCEERGWLRTSPATIRRDVECFIRSYVPRTGSKFSEDSMEPVLAELGLIRSVSTKSFEFRRGPKPNLPDGVFLFALARFWDAHAPAQNTIAVETLAYEPGSPGRAFKLDETSLIERLARIDDSSHGHFAWSDTAGVRNVARQIETVEPLALLDLAYEVGNRRRAA